MITICCPNCGTVLHRNSQAAVGVSRRQKQVLDFVVHELVAGRVAPTYRQIAEHMGIKSPVTPMRMVAKLEARGLIARPTPGMASGLFVTAEGWKLYATR